MAWSHLSVEPDLHLLSLKLFVDVLKQVITWRWSVNLGLDFSSVERGAGTNNFIPAHRWISGMVAVVAGHSP
ncbi:Uncharacterized protein APZ42_009514 [Daphnia magna]|uniref:Uncharacterized protein n=1 Tax=Daphnia magna TaxID=35525 RepID=A0A162BQQ6_9CRUS|nr:Uncharacterized protein APZ42_009514 [Daphnia magna]